MVQVAARGGRLAGWARKEVDDELRVEAHRGKADLASAELGLALDR
jgi:hypothetical protein